MKVLITGAAGFVGTAVTKALLRRGALCDRQGAMRPIDDLVLADVVPMQAPSPARGVRVHVETGDAGDPAFLRHLLGDGVDSVFHLAAWLTMDAEADFSQGLEVNVHGLMRLLELCRALPGAPRLVFASSIAAFGGPLPKTVDDSVAQTPQTSYGTHKAIAELLINDYSRKGFIDGRALRLPVVMTRPGASTPAVSDRIAAIVREPLLGRDTVCPLSADTRIPVASVQRVAGAFLALHDLPPVAFGHTRAMNLPSLTVSIGEIIAAVERAGRDRAPGRITVAPDPVLQSVVDGWPSAFVSARASRHGIGADASIDALVQAFLDDCASAPGVD